MSFCFPCFPRGASERLVSKQTEPQTILNVRGGVVQPGVFHALLGLTVHNPLDHNQTKNVIVDLCWKPRVLEWTDEEMAETQEMITVDALGTQLPRGEANESVAVFSAKSYSQWRLKENLTVGKCLLDMVDLRKYRKEQPWNPKYYNCHDFIAEKLPGLIEQACTINQMDLAYVLENGVLSTRLHTEELFGGKGACPSKVIECYVRYAGGFTGTSSCKSYQSLDSSATMIYSGYNRHPLQKGSQHTQICPANWVVNRVSVLFRQQPCPHWSLGPLGVSKANIRKTHASKAEVLRRLQ